MRWNGLRWKGAWADVIDVTDSQRSGQLPRFELVAGATPLHRLAAVESLCDTGPLWVKRDDLTGFAVAGNKARTLEYLVGDALAGEAEVFVTGGRPGSNFCSAAAAAGAAAGLEVHLVMAIPPGQAPSANMALATASGAHIVPIPPTPDLDNAIASYAEGLRQAGRRVYDVPRGGATPVGALGYADAAHELSEQLFGAPDQPVQVVVAVGTGGTVAGLLTGRGETGSNWALAGVCVSTPAAEMAGRITRIAAGCAALRGTRPGVGLTLTDAAGAHGVLTDAQSALADLALRHEGLLLDSTYTAKSFERAVVLARQTTRPTIFWHTGGLLGALTRVTEARVSGATHQGGAS